MKVLVFGASGMIGSAMFRAAQCDKRLSGVGHIALQRCKEIFLQRTARRVGE